MESLADDRRHKRSQIHRVQKTDACVLLVIGGARLREGREGPPQPRVEDGF